MRRVFPILVTAGLTCLVVATPVAADPVSITSGFVVVTGPVTTGPISIAGTRGFSIQGLVDTGEGRVDPFHLACSPVCLPGSTISITSVFSGPAVVGEATLDGNQYQFTGSVNDPVAVSLWFEGTAKLPELGDSPTMLTAPFSAAPLSVFLTEDAIVPLNGLGMVTLSLSPSSIIPGVPRGWTVNQVRYDFRDVPDPVPEPATLTLFALGLTATTLRARMRRRAGKA